MVEDSWGAAASVCRSASVLVASASLTPGGGGEDQAEGEQRQPALIARERVPRNGGAPGSASAPG